jgi:two-component system alkaline phosphatase synthesis response regulator PhoP
MPAKILVADDEPDLLFMTAFTLRQLGGFEVIEARNGQEALQLAEQHQPDLIVLDVQMPHLTGYEVCRSIRQHATLAQTPVILLSAKSQHYEIEEGREAGATLYILKPYAPQHLVEAVKSLVAS